MSYQVLARKWRPQTFREMVGQEHVLRVLINALDHGNIHHAYLFTGTRGVGKTTIARILSKCLNCESAVSSEPCGQCGACEEISSGRFIDLIEVDAASRTRVEDTRELLDNVQYAPSCGRYKVYLIDEVHMLSNHSFNALLKTLEEPPPHIIFLLATTDPQKLPVTILSRCLQFNLKNMPPERIVQHLKMVLDKEMISYEEQALWQLARAAEGSMRDALTLTDQAIAYGAQNISLVDVVAMLGSIDQHQVHRILSHLVQGNAREILQSVEKMAVYSPDYQAVLSSLISILHRVAVAQIIPDLEDNSEGDWAQVLELAQQLTGEDVQLFYQIGLMGQTDLALTPDVRQGFEMVLLRMLAFKPEALINPPVTPLTSSSKPSSSNSVNSSQASASQSLADQTLPAADSPGNFPEPQTQQVRNKPSIMPELDVNVENVSSEKLNGRNVAAEVVNDHDKNATQISLTGTPAESADKTLDEVRGNCSLSCHTDWLNLFQYLSLGGMSRNLLAHCVFAKRDKDHYYFLIRSDDAAFLDSNHEKQLTDALGDLLQQVVSVTVTIGDYDTVKESPALRHTRLQQEKKQQAVEAFQTNGNVLAIVEQFSATIDVNSITPLS